MHSGSKAADSEIPIAGKDGEARTMHPRGHLSSRAQQAKGPGPRPAQDGRRANLFPWCCYCRYCLPMDTRLAFFLLSLTNIQCSFPEADTGPHTCPRSNPWNPWIGQLRSKRDLQMQWSWGPRDGAIILDYLGWPKMEQQGPYRIRGDRRSRGRRRGATSQTTWHL